MTKRDYNVELINQRIADFQSKGYKPSEVTIYFDMDNTLCLFSPFGDVGGACRAMYQKGFYRELICFPEAPAVLENLVNIGFNIKILSSCIDSPYCRKEKMEWVKYHLPFMNEEDVILIAVGEDKSKYIENPECSILVDDYFCNIENMYDGGGIAIKKTYSGKQRPIPQVESLVDIFSVLLYLNCIRK